FRTIDVVSVVKKLTFVSVPFRPAFAQYHVGKRGISGIERRMISQKVGRTLHGSHHNKTGSRRVLMGKLCPSAVKGGFHTFLNVADRVRVLAFVKFGKGIA